MQRLDVSGAVRPIYGSLGVKRLIVQYQMTFTPLLYLIFCVQNVQPQGVTSCNFAIILIMF